MPYFFAIIILLIIPGFFRNWVGVVAEVFNTSEAYMPLLIGAGGYVILVGIQNRSWQHNISWFQTFSHELTHAIFSLLTFNKIYGFNATSHWGGYLSYQGKSNMLIALSPYCVPIFTLFLLILSAIVRVEHETLVVGLIGLTFMFHIHTFIKQTRSHQPDLKIYGLIPSYSFILFFNLFFSGVIFLSLKDGLWAFITFAEGGFRYSYDFLVTYFN